MMTRGLRHRQKGMTLISMMVGMVISLLTIGAMLAVYKMMIDVSGDATHSAQRDAQVASALLAVQVEAQSAGYRVSTSSSGAHVPLDDVLWVSDQADSVQVAAWKYEDGGDLKCSGVAIKAADQSTSPEAADIYRLREETCASAATYGQTKQGQPLEADLLLAALPKNPGFRGSEVAEGGRARLESAFFSIEQTEGCSLPYAQQVIDPDKKHPVAPQLRLSYSQSGVDDTLLFSTCLSNIVVRVEPGA